jgi:Rad3-related DNA helicase
MVMDSSVATLFHEAERLDNRSLDAFINNILSLRVQRKTSDKQKEEAILLQKINKSLAIEQIERFRALNEKHLDNNISEQEHLELGVLIEKIEKLNVTRLKYLISLAQLRNITVRELMNQLGISNFVNYN